MNGKRVEYNRAVGECREVWESCERAGGAHGIVMGGANTCVFIG